MNAITKISIPLFLMTGVMIVLLTSCKKEDDKALRESHCKNANLSLVKTEEAKSDQPSKEE